MKHVERVVLEVAKEFAQLSGREYGLFRGIPAGRRGAGSCNDRFRSRNHKRCH